MAKYQEILRQPGAAFKSKSITMDEYRELAWEIDSVKNHIKNPGKILKDAEIQADLKTGSNSNAKDKLLKEINNSI